MICRFPAKDGERCPFVVGEIKQRKLPRLPGRPSFRVLSVKLQLLGTVTLADIAAEGFTGRRAYERYCLDWVRRNDRWARTHPAASDAQIMERWRTRHATRNAWVVRLDLLEERLCMAEQEDILSGRTAPGIGVMQSSDQYVSSGGIDWHAEGVDRAYVERVSEPARRRDADMRASLARDIEQARAERRAQQGRRFRTGG